MKKILLICLTFFTLMLSAQLSWALTYVWTGTSSTDWKTPGNWKVGTTVQTVNYPGSSATTDIVQIGVASGTITNWPVLSAALANPVASITIGVLGGTSPSLTVNSPAILTVTGDITYTTASTFDATLDGSGTINAANLNATSTSTANSTNTSTLTSSIANLTLSSNLIITTDLRTSGTKTHDVTFSLASGALSLAGITTNNPNAANTSTITIGNNTTLNFSGGTAAELTTLDNVGTNSITFGTGVTIGYTGSTAQTVYTDAAIANSSLSSGISYVNLTLSGAGSKTTAGTGSNNLNISGNFNNSTGSLVSLTAATTFNGTGAQLITLGSGITFSNITFGGSGITTVSAGTMNITGSFTNSLPNDASNYVDFTTNSTSVNFTGTTQSLAGGNGNGTDFKNVTFSGTGIKTMASGTFDVISTGTLTLSGSTTQLAAGGLLTLRSGLSGSAAVAAITSGSSITGNVNVERYLTGGATNSRGWRLLSSPVAAANGNAITPNLTYVHTNAYTTGTTGTGGGFDATGNPTFYFYRENMAPNFTSFITGNFRGVNKINNTAASTFSFDGGDADASLPVGNGFLFFFRGDRANTTPKPPTSSSTVAQPTVLTATGYLNQGAVTVKPWFTGASTLSYTSGTPTTVRGFNLVGNPYASSINWDAAGITKTAIANSIWIYNPQLKVYATYVGGTSGVGTNFNGTSGSANIIPSGQGFFVKATSTLAALTFAETSKVSTQVASTNLLLAGTSTPAPVTYLRLVLFKDSLTREDALIFFNATASPNYVADEDADYFIGESSVHISSRSPDNHDLAINQMPFSLTRQQIPLNVIIGRTATYKLDLSEAKNIPSRYKIYLVDAYKKDSVDIKKQPVYTFTADSTNANTFGSSRFYLVVNQNDSSAYKLTDLAAVKSVSGVSLIWKTVNESTNLNFTVERSNDGGATYSLLGTMSSSGLGTYSFVDKSPQAGVNIYRLKQQDNFGGLTYTQVSINYSAAGTTNSVGVYPNPATSTIKLVITEIAKAIPDSTLPDYAIAISNSTGNIITSAKTSKPASWQADVSTYAPGMYFLRVINNNTKTVVGNSKFVKL